MDCFPLNLAKCAVIKPLALQQTTSWRAFDSFFQIGLVDCIYAGMPLRSEYPCAEGDLSPSHLLGLYFFSLLFCISLCYIIWLKVASIAVDCQDVLETLIPVRCGNTGSQAFLCLHVRFSTTL